jgi:hypothetical protein
MKIPKTLKIGGTTFKVIQAKEWIGGDGLDGEVIRSKEKGNVIYLNSTQSDDSMEVTVIHEAMHAMNSTINHVALDSLSYQLHQFLKDNDFLK